MGKDAHEGHASERDQVVDLEFAMPVLEQYGTADTVEEDTLDDARDRLFPGWWMYLHLQDAGTRDERPTYRVVVSSEAEERLARAACPTFVEAEISLDPSGSYS